MTQRSQHPRRRGRRHPLASVALVTIGLLFTGGAYALVTTPAIAATEQETTTSEASAEVLEQGRRLFEANCATCHGLALQGSTTGPSLIGVGAASVDFQVGTGRMPLAQDAPQAPDKPVIFSPEKTRAMAEYVQSIAPGPDYPPEAYLALDGDATRGAELFRINCAMCHNVAGAGGALTQGKYAPALQETAPVHIYEAMLTGPQNMPVFNDENLTPQDKQDIITAIKYNVANEQVAGFNLGALGPVAEGLFLWIFGLGAIIAFCVWLTAKAS